MTNILLVIVSLLIGIFLQRIPDFKLIFAPLLIYVLYDLILGNSPKDKLIYQVSVMESGMAPMISGSIIAISHGLNSRLASLMVGIGIPLSFLTLAVWYFLLV